MQISEPGLDFYSCQGKANRCEAPEGPLSRAPPHTVILSSFNVTTAAHCQPKETKMDEWIKSINPKLYTVCVCVRACVNFFFIPGVFRFHVETGNWIINDLASLSKEKCEIITQNLIEIFLTLLSLSRVKFSTAVTVIWCAPRNQSNAFCIALF